MCAPHLSLHTQSSHLASESSTPTVPAGRLATSWTNSCLPGLASQPSWLTLNLSASASHRRRRRRHPGRARCGIVTASSHHGSPLARARRTGECSCRQSRDPPGRRGNDTVARLDLRLGRHRSAGRQQAARTGSGNNRIPPQPVYDTGRDSLYLLADDERYEDEHPRAPGRPRTKSNPDTAG